MSEIEAPAKLSRAQARDLRLLSQGMGKIAGIRNPQRTVLRRLGLVEMLTISMFPDWRITKRGRAWLRTNPNAGRT